MIKRKIEMVAARKLPTSTSVSDQSLFLVNLAHKKPCPPTAAADKPVRTGAECHRKTARPRNQAQHNEIGIDAHPEAKNGRPSDGAHENWRLEAILFVPAVAERGDGAAEEEAAEQHQCRWRV